LEADHTEIERWLIGHAHELAAHQIDPGAIRLDAARFGPDLARVARSIFAAWLDRL
jgi:GMP synthase (glutamine-hydrolysing)